MEVRPWPMSCQLHPPVVCEDRSIRDPQVGTTSRGESLAALRATPNWIASPRVFLNFQSDTAPILSFNSVRTRLTMPLSGFRTVPLPLLFLRYSRCPLSTLRYRRIQGFDCAEPAPKCLRKLESSTFARQSPIVILAGLAILGSHEKPARPW